MSEVEIKLSKNEALVLFELLCRFADKDTLGIEDPSEARALWNLGALLEKALLEPFQGDYGEVIEAARSKLRNASGAGAKRETPGARLALWLAPEDVMFLADEWRKIPAGVPEKVSDSWSRIAFRAMSALHKLGIEYVPAFPDANEKYKSAT